MTALAWAVSAFSIAVIVWGLVSMVRMVHGVVREAADRDARRGGR